MQMGGALDELSLVASTMVGATLALYKHPMPQNFQESLSDFLSAALDQMAASVTLINGRLPLDSSEEALKEVARSVSMRLQNSHSSTQAWHATIAVYCQHGLCIPAHAALCVQCGTVVVPAAHDEHGLLSQPHCMRLHALHCQGGG